MIKTLAHSQNDRCHSEHHKSTKSDDRSHVNFSGKRDLLKCGISKFFMSSASQVSGNARMSSRRFSRSHVMKIRNVHSFEFIRVNGSGVVAPWSWSRPSVDFLRSHQEVHGVPGFDRIDVAPSNGEFMERVCDDYSLVEQGDFRSEKQQESCVTEEKIKDHSGNSCFHATFVEIRSSYANTENENTKPVGEIASRTKSFTVGHMESFSWNIERSAA